MRAREREPELVQELPMEVRHAPRHTHTITLTLTVMVMLVVEVVAVPVQLLLLDRSASGHHDSSNIQVDEARAKAFSMPRTQARS